MLFLKRFHQYCCCFFLKNSRKILIVIFGEILASPKIGHFIGRIVFFFLKKSAILERVYVFPSNNWLH